MSIAAIVLAAGRSTRMGGPNKLMEELGGKPLVRWVAEAAIRAGLSPIIVVTGHEAARVQQLLEDLPVAFIHNPDFADGLSTSVRKGIAALGEQADGAMILLGDMPRVDAPLIRRLVAAFEAMPRGVAAVPVHEGEWGNPVVLARAMFPQVMTLTGDAGARKLLAACKDDVIEVPMGDDAVVHDIDTPDMLAKLRAKRD